MKTHSFLRWAGDGSRALAKKVLLGLMLVCVGHWLNTPLLAAERRWTGDANNLWSNPNNWDPVGTPQNGEDLEFSEFSLNRVVVNDLANFAVRQLRFRDGYNVSGNTLSILEGIRLPLISGENYTVTISCGITLGADATIQVDAGSGNIDTDPNELYLRGPIDLNGHHLQLRATVASLGDKILFSKIFVSSPISGIGNVTAHPGTKCSIVFDGNEGNTFSGTLRAVSTGTDSDPPRIRLNKTAGVAVNDRLEVFGRVVLDHDDQIGDQATVAFGAEMNDRSFLNFQGHSDTFAHLVFTNRNLLADAVFLDTAGGILTLLGDITTDTVDATPILKGQINLPAGNHTFDIGGSLFYGIDVQAQIIGAGGFTKVGDAALLLQTSNAFSGLVVVNEDVVEARDGRAFGAGGSGVQLNGGSVNLRNVAITTEPLTVTDPRSSLLGFGTCAWAGSITLNRQLTIFGDDFRFPGVIVGTGDLSLLGTDIEFSGSFPNTFTGATRVNCTRLTLNKAATGSAFALSGSLIIAQDSFAPIEVRWLNDFQINRTTTPVTLGSLATLNLNGHNDTIGSLTFNGGTVQNAGLATLSLFQTVTANVATAMASISGGRLALSSGQRQFHIEDGLFGPDLSITAAIADLGGITKTGSGTLRLIGQNSFAGSVSVNEGAVIVAHASALGTTEAGTFVNNNASLALDGIDVVDETLTLDSTNAGALTSFGPVTNV
jgi:autotransporter-associated beta strand protein